MSTLTHKFLTLGIALLLLFQQGVAEAQSSPKVALTGGKFGSCHPPGGLAGGSLGICDPPDGLADGSFGFCQLADGLGPYSASLLTLRQRSLCALCKCQCECSAHACAARQDSHAIASS